MKKVHIIGSGFSSLAAAAYLAKAGYEVEVLEKNAEVGGRARKFEAEGFVFDMGPSWYWMPDVFEDFFADFGKKVSDYYELVRLDPSYQVIFENEEIFEVPANETDLIAAFEQIESGSGIKLKAFLTEAQYKYEVGMKELAKKPSLSIMEFADKRVLQNLFKMDLFSSLSNSVRKQFKHPKLIKLLEFPVLFLGAKPSNIPALYSLMNYADLSMGTWYPKGGMHQIIAAMHQLCLELGVTFKCNTPITEIKALKNGQVSHLNSDQIEIPVDLVISGADYAHTESIIKDANHRNYSPKYWDKKTFAPSSIIFYLGVDAKIPKLLHHNLFFDEDFEQHAEEIYDKPKTPEAPLFYVCAPSITDETVAPPGKENLFILIPVAPGLEDNEAMRATLFDKVMGRLEQFCKTDIRNKIIYQRSFGVTDFEKEYHSYKGNAYGLANTLMQTAFLKPKIKNKRLSNLYYTGQLTVPGPGVPPSLLSGKLVSEQLMKEHGNR